LRVKAKGVGITHLADGTAKTVLGYNQDGVAAVIPAGAAGTILTANASTPPTFQTNLGAMKLLAYSQTVTSHTPTTQTAPHADAKLKSIIIPANHGFSHVMIEIDVQGQHSTAQVSAAISEWCLYVGGSEVKTWDMAEGNTTSSKPGEHSLTTLTWINDGVQDANEAGRTVDLYKKGTGTVSDDYGVVIYGIRIWGLTAPS
jgi:hypothetical protein